MNAAWPNLVSECFVSCVHDISASEVSEFLQLDMHHDTTSVGQSHNEFFTKCASWCEEQKVDGILQGERSMALDYLNSHYVARATRAGGQLGVAWWGKAKPVATTQKALHRSLRAKPSVQRI